MKTRQIGNSDLIVSELGLGCMSLGKEEKQASEIIHKATDSGINYLDTADLYDFGVNEEFVGRAIKSKRKDIILATKVGNRWNTSKKGWSWDPSKDYIKSVVKDSLLRLQTDYIDLYQLHGGTIEDNIDETIEAFEDLKKEGLIRYYGISSIRPNVIKEYIERSSIVSVMMQYSLLDRRPEEVFPLLKEHNISVVCRGPVAKGLLTDKPLESTNSKIKENGYLDYSYEELASLRQSLKEELASERSLTEIALQYCLYDSVVASVVAGASKIEQLVDNVEAVSSTPLTDNQVRILRELSKASLYEQHRM
ncbi:aldo/keto reductase [Bacillus luteolus]|uniref:Aldo/keto reductase n=1 Tax=Litchfieldia luteola TaxID=682179 RepID=A0ABR9QPF3_9BACI|nr:aldo/keto reductase [Cytobacillus luteolus]MBE4910378.1 aldo/keto reductase [Cytobacillus luteolus]MBP1942047.1 aryl-alcohol dehydrogenase-like predicted oxidoreductase [Cytobacillus luteolus]